MTEVKTGRPRPTIVGEVLFDRFPDGTQVLGGAPFNVAWHLQGFGVHPVLVSRVGDDAAGERVRDAMSGWGMDPSGIQTDPGHPTGAVDIRFTGNTHSFDILEHQAYDHVSREQLTRSILETAPELVYQGTLIMRAEQTRDVFQDVLCQTTVPLFVDINLREPWWRKEDFPWLLERARWVKVNDEELEIIADLLELSGKCLDSKGRSLQDAHGIDLVIVTLGSKGACALQRDAPALDVTPEPAKEVIDTVGAGDAFASVCLLGLLRGWPLATTLERAQQFAGRIVQQRGSTSRDRQLYAQLLREWSVA